MFLYEHKVQYYETDQMAIVHHSNYIRWFESARLEYMEKLGMSYAEMERKGIFSPVLHVQCDFKRMVKFGETVQVSVKVVKYTGIKLEVAYEVRDKVTGELKTTGLTRHCFLNEKGRPVALQKELKDLDESLNKEYELYLSEVGV